MEINGMNRKVIQKNNRKRTCTVFVYSECSAVKTIAVEHVNIFF